MTTYAKTKVEQDSKQAALPDGTFQYSIRTTVIEKGELPHEYMFVFKILDPADPKEDSFERVGTPYDLEVDNHQTSRDAAIALEQEEYLAATMLKTYTELEVAVQAKEAIVSRVEDSVSSWITYMNDFAGVSEVLHPTGDPAIEEALVTTYTGAKQARKDAEVAVSDAEDAIVLAEAVASLATEKVSIYQAEVEFCAQANLVYWAKYYEAVGAYTPQVTSFITSSELFIDDAQGSFDATVDMYNDITGVTYPEEAAGGEWDHVHTALQLFEASLSSYGGGSLPTIKTAQSVFQQNENYGTSLNGAFSTFCGTSNANYNVAVANKSLKDKEVADAVTAKENANATLVAAQTAEDEALANILALCPAFDPNSV